MKHIKLVAAVGIVFLFILSGVNAQTTQIKKPAPTTPATQKSPKKTPTTNNTPASPVKAPNEQANIPPNDARITFEYSLFDFGVVPPGSQVTHHFPVSNTGTDTLYITKIKAG